MIPFTLDLETKIDTYEQLDLMQGFDYDFDFNILECGNKADLVGYVAQIQMQKSNKNYIIQTENITIVGNVIKVKLDKDLTRNSGKAKLQIVLVKNARVFGSWVIKLRIKESALNDSDGQSASKATITETLTLKIAEATIVRNETEALIKGGGAATTGALQITNNKVLALENGKVDKITGKGLSTNDYTTVEKTEVAKIKDKANNVNNNLSTTAKDIVGAINELTIDNTRTTSSKSITGAINELNAKSEIVRGSNANGEYIRFYDGTQICTKILSLGSIAIDIAWGGIYSSGYKALGNWAISFNATPVTTISLTSDGGASAFISAIKADNNASCGSVELFRGAGAASAGNFYAKLIAIGKWK